MRIVWDPAKAHSNLAKHGVAFETFRRLNTTSALVIPDTSHGEGREKVLALIDRRLHVAVIARRGDDIRVISLRKANAREVRMYEARRSSRP